VLAHLTLDKPSGVGEWAGSAMASPIFTIAALAGERSGIGSRRSAPSPARDSWTGHCQVAENILALISMGTRAAPASSNNSSLQRDRDGRDE
jgi:hypothetical protein